MADELIPQFEIEDIPDADLLFQRVHKHNVKDGKPVPGPFKNKPDGAEGLSVDWSKYSTATDTRDRARKPSENGVIKFTTEKARGIPGQTVEHRPVNDKDSLNQAHSEVVGEKDVEVRAHFLRIFEWEITI